MSSAATAGFPNSHFRNSDGGKPVAARNGYLQEGEGGKRSDTIYRHIRDLVAARPDIDINAPIRKILLEGERHAKNADSFYDFRRPDLALEEYLKASIVAVDIVPRHKDYPELQSDRGELHRLYLGLKKRINSQQDRFNGVKNVIKENNSQYGTQPAAYNGHPIPASHNNQINSFDAAGDKGILSSHKSFPRSNELSSALPANKLPSPRPSIASGSGSRPMIHPKPEALQGKSIKSKEISAQSAEDLASRFARLRGAEAVSPDEHSSPSTLPLVQDPRIITRPIVVPPYSLSLSSNPAQSYSRSGRDIPSEPSKPLKIALGVEIPQMPRPPEAVYSPARSLESNSHSQILPDHSKAFNNYISKASSIDSTMDLGRTMSVDDSNPYFYTASVENSSFGKGHVPDLLRLKNVTAQQLQQFMQMGSQNLSILLVDIRNREDFDSGHILWHSIICCEPISLKDGVSADEIEQRMVISPDAEQQLYMQRHKYSLVVYYDQSTSSSSKSPDYGDEAPLQNFHKAVYDYAYEKRLQNKPLLLEGGLDAWIDLFGEGALVTSKSALTEKASTRNGNNLRPLATSAGVSGTRNGTAVSSATARGGNHQEKREIERREHFPTESEADREGSTDDFYIKTAEEFMRRFPAASDIKESMMSPSSRLILASQVPARPERAVVPGGGGQPHMFSRLNTTKPASDFRSLWGDGHCGLLNQSNLCYMNAAIQALSSIHELRDYLFRGAWVKNKPTRDPPQSPATLDDQQLVTKTFSSLLMHLWSADAVKCSYINPRTFVATINRLHMHHQGLSDRQNLLGGPKQQDSDEFIQFLLQKLYAETSTAHVSTPDRSDDYRKWLDEQQDISVASIDAYRRSKPENLSPIAKLTSYMCVKDLTCKNCNKKIHLVDDTIAHTTIAHFPEQGRSRRFTLRELLLHGRKEDPVEDFACKYCKEKSVIRQNNIFYVRLPNILMIRLTREKTVIANMLDAKGKAYQDRKLEKIEMPVVFPENDLDLAEFLVPGKYGPESMTSTKYDCFAVVCHLGNTLKAGHYTAYRRDMAMESNKLRYQKWWFYNDTVTKECTFGDISQAEAYILFYRLQSTSGGIIG